MHWCQDETLALMYFLSSFPLIGMWFRMKYAERKAKHDQNEEHDCHAATTLGSRTQDSKQHP